MEKGQTELVRSNGWLDFPGDSGGKEPADNVGHLDSVPGWENPLRKDMATHSSIFAWEIPWIEEPGGL